MSILLQILKRGGVSRFMEVVVKLLEFSLRSSVPVPMESLFFFNIESSLLNLGMV